MIQLLAMLRICRNNEKYIYIWFLKSYVDHQRSWITYHGLHGFYFQNQRLSHDIVVLCVTHFPLTYIIWGSTHWAGPYIGVLMQWASKIFTAHILLSSLRGKSLILLDTLENCIYESAQCNLCVDNGKKMWFLDQEWVFFPICDIPGNNVVINLEAGALPANRISRCPINQQDKVVTLLRLYVITKYIVPCERFTLYV